MERLPREHEDRFLVLIDHDDDVQEILTIVCEGRPRAARSDLTDWQAGAS